MKLPLLHTVKTIIPSFKTAVDFQSQLIQLQKDGAVAEMNQAETMNQQFQRLMIAVGVLSVVSLLLSLWISRRITVPLGQVVEVLKKVANGDLNIDLELQSRDEIGQLNQSIRDMRDQLLRVVSEVRDGSDSVCNASQQVSATAQSMSQMATEQAASVEETTSSIEELNASVQQNTENAHVTEQMAAQSAGEARNGGEAVKETVNLKKSVEFSRIL